MTNHTMNKNVTVRIKQITKGKTFILKAKVFFCVLAVILYFFEKRSVRFFYMYWSKRFKKYKKKIVTLLMIS